MMSQNNRSRTLYCVESGSVLAAALDINKDLGAFPVTSVSYRGTKGSGGQVVGPSHTLLLKRIVGRSYSVEVTVLYCFYFSVGPPHTLQIPEDEEAPGDFLGMISRANVAALLELHGKEDEEINLIPKVWAAGGWMGAALVTRILCETYMCGH